MSEDVKARLLAVHQKGMDDGMSGMTSGEALRIRITYDTAVERTLYNTGFETGSLLHWACREDNHTVT